MLIIENFKKYKLENNDLQFYHSYVFLYAYINVYVDLFYNNRVILSFEAYFFHLICCEHFPIISHTLKIKNLSACKAFYVESLL